MKMKRGKKVLLIISVIIILGLVCVGLFGGKLSPNEEAEIIKEKLVPLNTVEVGNGFQDLKEFKDIFKDKQIIALGGATYGTKEFFQIKHRMLEFLVEEMGYRTFAMDVDFGRTELINNYILNGEGNAENIVRQTKINGGYSWSTVESLELIEWMRKYNEDSNHKEKIKFYGIQVTNAEDSSNFVINYLRDIDEDLYKKFDGELDEVRGRPVRNIPTSELRREQEKVEILINIFNQNKDKFVKSTSEEKYEEASKYLQSILKSIELAIYSGPEHNIKEALNMEGKLLADNIKWILERESKNENDKIVLWSGNQHISNISKDYKSMGYNLKEMYKDKYYSLALEFHQGSFGAYPIDSSGVGSEYEIYNIEEGNPQLFSNIFNLTEISNSFIDFKSSSQDKDVKKILSSSILMHNIIFYNGYEEDYYMKLKPIDTFDGLIFIRDTNAISKLK